MSTPPEDKHNSSSSSSGITAITAEPATSNATSNGVQALPKGAMPSTIPSLSFQPALSPRRFTDPDHPPSPPATPSPSQRLLDAESSHVQFASYPVTPDEKTRPLVEEEVELPRGWVPPPLRGWYAISLIVLLVCLAVALEVALHFTNKHNGWKTHGNTTDVTGVWHYIYTLPPVIVAAVIVALWTWTDIEIKKMQPYVDLARGDAPPHKSLLLDYTRSSNFWVWTHAAHNRHWVVTAASLMVLVTLTFQPLCSALLTVKNTWIPLDPLTVNTVSTVGLNQSAEFEDLTIFLTAAGYASANVGYDLQAPPFVFNSYTVMPFRIPTDVVQNGTILANVTAVRTDTQCTAVQVQMTNHTDGSGWTNSLTSGNCNFQFVVDRSAETLFGTSTPNCGDTTPPQFLPSIFWFFTYVPTAQSSATFCQPAITLVDAEVTIDIGGGNVTNVRELRPFNAASSSFGSLSGNITGAPLNGRAYNGVNFTLTNPDKFTNARMSAIQLTMPAAVFQAAVQSSAGIAGSFTSDAFVTWSNKVYATYLTLIAKAVYFLDNAEPVTLQVRTFEERLWMSAVAVHLLTTLFLLLACVAAVIHIFHRYERQDLNLVHMPGTIASAVSIGAETGMGQLLAETRDPEAVREVLADRKFRIDPFTNKIVMDGEEGYNALGSPTNPRLSVFGAMQNRRASRRFSRVAPSSPRTPGTPRTPRSASGAV